MKAFLTLISIFGLVGLAGCLDGNRLPSTDPAMPAEDPQPADSPTEENPAPYDRAWPAGAGQNGSNQEESLQVAVESDFAEIHVSGPVTAAQATYHSGNRTRLANATGAAGNLTLLVGFLSSDSLYNVTVTTMPSGTAYSLAIRTAAATKSWAQAGPGTIQPGANTLGAGTLNFVLRDARNETLYVLSAGHSSADGAEVTLMRDGLYPEDRPFGDVVARSTAEATGDWALIRIREPARQDVSPQVKWFGGPSGSPGTPVARGAQVCAFGQGIVAGPDEVRARCGNVLFSQPDPAGQQRGFYSTMRGRPGDSGAPVVDPRTGHALGMLLGGVPEATVTFSDATCWTLQRVREAGYELELATAPLLPGSPWVDVPLSSLSPYTCPDAPR